MPFDAAAFIRTRLHLLPVPSVPEIVIHTAHSGSGLGHLLEQSAEPDPPAPYWAYPWAGGVALARYILDRPEIVRGHRVLDLGSGSGLVAIAAAMAGAASVLAAEIDANGRVALRLNAEANGKSVQVLDADIIAGLPLPVEIVLAGDVFYDAAVAAPMLAFLDRCQAAGQHVLVGDPYRTALPLQRLRRLIDYQVSDVGSARHASAVTSGVFQLRPRTA